MLNLQNFNQYAEQMSHCVKKEKSTKITEKTHKKVMQTMLGFCWVLFFWDSSGAIYQY